MTVSRADADLVRRSESGTGFSGAVLCERRLPVVIDERRVDPTDPCGVFTRGPGRWRDRVAVRPTGRRNTCRNRWPSGPPTKADAVRDAGLRTSVVESFVDDTDSAPGSDGRYSSGARPDRTANWTRRRGYSSSSSTTSGSLIALWRLSSPLIHSVTRPYSRSSATDMSSSSPSMMSVPACAA